MRAFEILSNRGMCKGSSRCYESSREFSLGGSMIGRAGRALASAGATVAVIMLVSPAVAEPNADWKCNAQTEVPLDERIAACTSVLDSGKYGRPALIRAYFNRAGAYCKKGEFERAAVDYSTLIELYPANVPAYTGRAYSYFHSGDLDRAIADYNRTIQLNPRSRYAYYSRGVAHYRKGDYDQAIADYTQAMQLRQQSHSISGDQHAVVKHKGGDLAPPPISDERAIELDSSDGVAFHARGAAHYGKGDLDRAIADYDQAIRLNPKYKEPLMYRAVAYKIKGDLDRAMTDWDRVIQLDPEDARAYRQRAMLHQRKGSLAKSLADLDHASTLDPKSPYTALLRDIVGNQSNMPSRLAEATAQFDMTKWPAPIVRLFLGELTTEAMFAAAEDGDPQKKKDQICEANFYAGQLALQRGAREEAGRLFELAAADCPKTFVEWEAANAELSALRANP